MVYILLRSITKTLHKIQHWNTLCGPFLADFDCLTSPGHGSRRNSLSRSTLLHFTTQRKEDEPRGLYWLVSYKQDLQWPLVNTRYLIGSLESKSCQNGAKKLVHCTCIWTRRPFAKCRLLISIKISSTKDMNPITRKSMSKLVTQSSFRAVGQTHTEGKTFEKP